MTAVDWTQCVEPWRSLGPEAREVFDMICGNEARASSTGAPLRPPVRQKTLGQELLDARARRHVTQRQLAKILLCSNSTISLIENGLVARPNNELRTRIEEFIRE